MNRNYGLALVFSWMLTPLANSYADNTIDTTPSLEIGSRVYSQRCTLCHGSQGMGDGVLPLKMGAYPNTNLRKPIKVSSPQDIHKAIVYGGSNGKLSKLMPPFGDELTWTELESVSKLVFALRSDTKTAVKLISQEMSGNSDHKVTGQKIYETRCVLCHGKYGEGDGRMSKLLKTPPPANLIKSRLPEKMVYQIISEGGEGVGRSKHMPPWKDQLNASEINAVVEYLNAMRR